MTTTWKPSEIEGLIRYLTQEEQRTVYMLVHFAEQARSRPDSTWGPIDDGTGRAFDAGEGQTSADFVADLDLQLGAMMRRAVLRKAGVLN
jgi:hypothetical protein